MGHRQQRFLVREPDPLSLSRNRPDLRVDRLAGLTTEIRAVGTTSYLDIMLGLAVVLFAVIVVLTAKLPRSIGFLMPYLASASSSSAGSSGHAASPPAIPCRSIPVTDSSSSQ